MAQDRIAASPQSPALGALARHLRAARSFGDEARIPLIDMGLGELLLGKAPEEIEEWSYGNLPFQQGREGIGSRAPQLKRGRAEGFMDAMMGALDAAGVGAFARRGLTAAAGLRQVGDRYVTLDELKDVPRTADGLPIGYQPLDDLPGWKDGGLVDGGIDDPVQFALQWRELVDAENGYRRA